MVFRQIRVVNLNGDISAKQIFDFEIHIVARDFKIRLFVLLDYKVFGVLEYIMFGVGTEGICVE